MRRKELENILILGIESSCDETSVSVVRNGREVLSNVINSQIDIHKEYGGVVPEIASRCHTEVINQITKQAVKEAGYPLSDYALRLGILGSEPCTPAMRSQIEANFNIRVSDNYGMTELGGPGVSGDCEARNGMHFAEDHFLPEIIDHDTGKRLPEGEVGELVITTLTRRGMPVLRYRTKDITKITYEPCPCGRTHARMAKTMGRTDDMMIIKGVNVFPTQIENILINIKDIAPHYMLIITREHFKDSLEIKVELDNAELLDNYQRLSDLKKHIEAKMQSILGLRTKVTLVAPKTIERFQGKAKRIVDLRNQ